MFGAFNYKSIKYQHKCNITVTQSVRYKYGTHLAVCTHDGYKITLKRRTISLPITLYGYQSDLNFYVRRYVHNPVTSCSPACGFHFADVHIWQKDQEQKSKDR